MGAIALLLLNKEAKPSDVELKLKQQETLVKSLYDSISKSETSRANLLSERDSLIQVNHNAESKLDQSKKELAKIKGSTKNLTNSELVVEANELYGGSDTTKLEILLSRPTTEFLVESAKQVEILSNQLELSLSLNYSQAETIRLDEQVFKTYEDDKANYHSIIQSKDQSISLVLSENNKLDKRNRRQKTITKIAIGIGIGGLIYGITR